MVLTKPRRAKDHKVVESGMASMSIVEESSTGSINSSGSIQGLVKNHRQSYDNREIETRSEWAHSSYDLNTEVEMDENKVVQHTRRDSTAEGVTPSDPYAIVDLFQEMESIGSANWVGGSDTESTTGEGEESSDHPPPRTVFQGITGTCIDMGAGSGCSGVQQMANPGPMMAPASMSTATFAEQVYQEKQPQQIVQQKPEQHNSHHPQGNHIQKLWGRVKPDTPTRSGSTNSEFSTGLNTESTPAGLQRLDRGPEVEPTQRKQSQKQQPAAGAAAYSAPALESVPPPPVLKENRTSVGASEGGDTSHASAPLRRKTSMGSFQRGMGESLTGRLRKQLDIPREPKVEINTNIAKDDIKNLHYLAQGAMCATYTAQLYGKVVVLKTPLPDTNHVEVAANDLEVEMLLLKELHHDNIVRLIGAGFFEDKRRFVALEYLSGGTLSRMLKSQTVPLGVSQVIDLSLKLCNALEYLHDVAVPGRIVCHRDLKPDNIAFAENGNLKLIDFGLGKIIKRKFRVRAESYHMTGGTGSLRYMAPEVADHQKYNEKADVYSFSLIMWEMLAGQKPFLGLKRADFYTRVVDQGERPPLDPTWPVHVRNLLESCWRTNLDERLSFREVAGILKVCAEEENQRLYERRKTIRLPARRKLWTTTGARPDLDDICNDAHYKPKFTISSFFSTHGRPGARGSNSTQAPTPKAEKKKKKNVRRASSNNT